MVDCRWKTANWWLVANCGKATNINQNHKDGSKGEHFHSIYKNHIKWVHLWRKRYFSHILNDLLKWNSLIIDRHRFKSISTRDLTGAIVSDSNRKILKIACEILWKSVRIHPARRLSPMLHRLCVLALIVCKALSVRITLAYTTVISVRSFKLDGYSFTFLLLWRP